MDRVTQARTVSLGQIGTELGWSRAQASNRVMNHLWLLRRLKRPGNRWDAHVIDVLRTLYGQAPDQPSDFLSEYLKEIR